MRLLFLITRADTIGGAQVHVRDLTRALLWKGHQVWVVTGTSGPYNVALNQLQIPNVACSALNRQIRPLQDWQTLAFFQRIIHQFQPHLVSTHSSKAGILGRLACRLTHTPCLFTAHGWAFTEGVPKLQKMLYSRLEQLAEPLAERIICVSEHDRQLGIAVGMNPDRLLTIHNGMPDIPFELRANPGSEGCIRVAMIARFDRQKDHDTLIKAVHSMPKIHLDLIGDGPRLKEIQTLVQALGMSERVKFWGYRSDIAELLSQVDIFALISNWEGFPRTIIEAMRAGLPIVASQVGGVAEAVADGVNGYCIPPGDVETLAEKLSCLAKNAQLRSQMGQAGRERYESEFTFQRMFEKTYAVYEQVLADRRQG